MANNKYNYRSVISQYGNRRKISETFTLGESVDNTWPRDPRMSARAKGILGVILSFPRTWQIRIDKLTRHFEDGKASIESGVEELIQLGYLTRNDI